MNQVIDKELQKVKKQLERLLGKKIVTNLLQQQENYGVFDDDIFAELVLELTNYCLIEMKRSPLKEISKRYQISYFKLNKLLGIVKAGIDSSETE